MKIRSEENFIMNDRVQRNVLSQKVRKFQNDMCAPPSDDHLYKSPNERASLCTLIRGSLTVDAALVMPFVWMILLAFFSFFSQYATAADLLVQAAAEAKKVGIVMGSVGSSQAGEVSITKTSKAEEFWIDPFWKTTKISSQAVCRAWIGYTKDDTEETYVYITPEGSVYHLYSDCTHLKLSVRSTTMGIVGSLKNEYGQAYRKCEVCSLPFKNLIYITSEGDCYHSDRNCSGLKRTIRRVPLSEAGGRSLCMRCMSRGE